MIENFGTYNCEDIKSRLIILHLALSEEPKSKGIVIVYEGKYAKYVDARNGKSTIKYILPSVGESIFRTREMQDILVFFKFPMENFLFIDGGFRENFEVELWVVPNDAKMPKPTPTLETMKYRKGAPMKTVCGGS